MVAQQLNHAFTKIIYWNKKYWENFFIFSCVREHVACNTVNMLYAIHWTCCMQHSEHVVHNTVNMLYLTQWTCFTRLILTRLQVKSETFKSYLYIMNPLAVITAAGLFLAAQSCSLGSNLWLSKWSDDTESFNITSTRNTYIGLYAVFGLAQGTCIICSCVS